ncbi:MAG TPA: bifunctional [glutamine synthetase] adenylyltransferase/[glutamine synthetase]-adenylyl-L-tyrosine phosphorylase [Mycobacteriales bacterium]|nr:bifunctional [glutamine synthetase] adenylyltransferase/[glutamine synthetase]-adenylyl-L-tyrosine phosphorylase [Mycobacteriales bacterium]
MSWPAEHPRGSSLPTRLARLGFSDVTRAAASVERLGLGNPDDDGAELVLGDLAAAADPDLALAALVRMAEAEPHHGKDLLSGLRFHTGLRERLLAVLGASTGLGDHLVRHSEDWRLLADDASVLSRPSAYGLRHRLLTAVGADPDAPITWGTGGATAASGWQHAEILDALRIEHTRALLSIAARDLTGMIPLDDVAAELADVAAAALDAALAVAAAGLPRVATPCRIAVIGMGKCGGRELNFVSDVDVVFVAEPLEGAGGDAGEQAALRTATALATGLIRACSAMSREGRLFPVDAALRPEGKAGPLVRTLASHEAYYQRWAHTWELQALLKARPVAGDLALGAAYVERIAPLVWTAAARPDLPAEVQAMRRRVEATLPSATAERELKLGPGGLRDVEFAVQLLQLVHGRADPSVRSGSTLTALQQLSDGGYVGREDAEQLAAAYRWLRTAEHRLQLQRLRRTHSVPTAEHDLRWIARAMGFRGDARQTAVEAFDAERRRHAVTVRRLHEKLFYRPLLGAVAQLGSDEARLTPAAARTRLQALGYADTNAALAHLTALTSGVSRRAAIQKTLLPVMLGWFAEEADPDAGLLAFRRVSDALGDTPWYLRWLRDEGAVADRLAHLLARSRYVSDLLTRAPEGMRLLDDATGNEELKLRDRSALTAELLAATQRSEEWEQAVAVARALRRHELLRIACSDLLGLVDQDAVATALTDCAAALVTAALDTAVRKVETEQRGPLPVRLAVIGMGRFGGGEMGYASDADVVFVHDAKPGVSQSDAAAAANAVAEEARRLLALPAPDPPLTLDPGLRPEGRQGALSRSLEAFARYHAQRALVWEQQALLRAAPIAGDDALTATFLEQVADVRWPSDLTAEDEVEVRRLRTRVAYERAAPGLPPRERWRDVKLGPGGVADVEWVAQLLQLRHAHELAELRTPRTLPVLDVAAREGLLDPDAAAILADGWRTATRLRNAIVLVTGKHVDVLPTDQRAARGVARVAGERVLDGWREQAKTVRSVADDVLSGKIGR